MSEENSDTGTKQPRKRSLTELTLGWLADRIRKAETIKANIEQGTYNVDTKKVAESIVNK